MIHLLYGDDELTIAETLSSIKRDAEPSDVGDLNTTVFEGREVSFAELSATCDTVPFLSERRLVIVQGLLTTFELKPAAQSRSKRTTNRASSPKLGEWDALAGYLTRIPNTTSLVFVEEKLSRRNPLLVAIYSNVTPRMFAAPNPGTLRQWIRNRCSAEGIDIEPEAINVLADTVGGDLRTIVSELQKLSTYRFGEAISRKDVDALVSYTRESNIFAAVDAVMERRPASAIELMHSLQQAGRPVTYILTMLARQIRLLIIAKELTANSIAIADIGKRLGLTGFPLRKTLSQESKLTQEQLVTMHRKLLEADLSIKREGIPEDVALDMLVVDLCSTHSYASTGGPSDYQQ